MNGSFLAEAVTNYPEISALVVLIAGFILAKLARRECARLLNLLDRLTSRYATSETSVISPVLVKTSQSAVYWLVVLFSVLIAMRLLGVGQLSQWLDGVLNYLPRVLVGLTIIGLGHMTGVLARYLVSRLSDQVEPTSTGPRIIHAAIVVIAVVMGLQHMKIDITFLTQLVLVAVAVSGAGLALAFALGARQYVSNLVAQSEVSRYAIGDRIRVDDVEGEIIEMTRSGVTVDSTEGLVSIPGARFLATNVVRLSAEIGDE